MNDLQDKVAVITGGASGVGQSQCAQLAISVTSAPRTLQKEGQGADNETGINSVDDMKGMAAEWGIELKSSHPDEVAAMAVEGIEQDAFWLYSRSC